MRYFLILFTLFLFKPIHSQDSLNANIYERYREDQFYASISYNLLSNATKNVSLSGFSTGFHFGFIRDMPLNKQRNWAIGLGLGISTNSYNQNLIILEENNDFQYAIESTDFIQNVTKNKFTTYLVELPFELRWRTSTARDYKFWRIYPGFKLSYLLYNSTKLRSDTININLSNIDDFNKLQYGLTLSAGYGTWNFQLYYGLNSILDDKAQLNGESIDMKSLKIGLMFYIL